MGFDEDRIRTLKLEKSELERMTSPLNNLIDNYALEVIHTAPAELYDSKWHQNIFFKDNSDIYIRRFVQCDPAVVDHVERHEYETGDMINNIYFEPFTCIWEKLEFREKEDELHKLIRNLIKNSGRDYIFSMSITKDLDVVQSLKNFKSFVIEKARVKYSEISNSIISKKSELASIDSLLRQKNDFKDYTGLKI